MLKKILRTRHFKNFSKNWIKTTDFEIVNKDAEELSGMIQNQKEKYQEKLLITETEKPKNQLQNRLVYN